MRRLFLVSIFTLVGCSGSSARTDGGGGGPDADGWKPPTDGWHPPADLIPEPDTVPPPPPTLPTFVNLDWNAFPTDPGPNYPVKGRVWVVKTSGNDGNAGTESSPLRTIVRGLSRAQPGDLVRVYAGTYAEGWPNDFRALLISKSNVVLTAAKGQQVTVTPKSSEFKYGIAIWGHNVVVNGINLKGFRYGIQVGLENSTQKNVVISNLKIEGGSSSNNEGINAYFDTTSQGFPTIDGLLVKNVQITNVWMGISCNAGICRSWRLENVKIVGQGGAGSGADAIAIEEGENMLFYKVEVSQVAADGIDAKAKDVVVWDCHVHHVQRNGVKLWYGGDIVNTRIHHTGADAALVTEYGPRVRLLHSVVAYHNHGGLTSFNMTFGYDSQAAQTVEIIDSIVFNTSGGTYCNGASTVRVENSLFHGMDNGNVIETGSGVIKLSQGPGAFKNLGIGEANIFADPMATADLHLQQGSPAINKGKALGADYPEQDAQGMPRVKGSAPDLGAFEDH